MSVVRTTLTKAVGRFRTQNRSFPFFIVRDIRRSCKTNMTALGIPKTDLDKLNNHAAQDVSAKLYDMHEYLEKKTATIETWDRVLGEEISKQK